MKRGDVVTVALQGVYGKPRPALIIQSDLLSALDSVVICPMTSTIREADFRVAIPMTSGNGLRADSQVMTDKIATVPRDKIGATIGALSSEQVREVERALTLVVGLAG